MIKRSKRELQGEAFGKICTKSKKSKTIYDWNQTVRFPFSINNVKLLTVTMWKPNEKQLTSLSDHRCWQCNQGNYYRSTYNTRLGRIIKSKSSTYRTTIINWNHFSNNQPDDWGAGTRGWKRETTKVYLETKKHSELLPLMVTRTHGQWRKKTSYYSCNTIFRVRYCYQKLLTSKSSWIS